MTPVSFDLIFLLVISLCVSLQEGITSEIIALSQGHNDIAELLVKLKPERREQCISQLMPTEQPLPRIKVKVFGSSQVGKSTVIDSLKCGYFGSFFRKARLSNSSSVTSAGKGEIKVISRVKII